MDFPKHHTQFLVLVEMILSYFTLTSFGRNVIWIFSSFDSSYWPVVVEMCISRYNTVANTDIFTLLISVN